MLVQLSFGHIIMVLPVSIELTTSRLQDGRSAKLSYGSVNWSPDPDLNRDA